MSVESNDRRIVKNTLILYIRTFLIIIVNLYVIRVVLRELGVEDYGIYNLVGGFVAMFSIVIQSLSSASQRFFAIQIGKGNLDALEREFSITYWTYLKIVIVLFVIAEVFGIYFINYQISTIPEDRIWAANCVFQFSMLSFVFSFLSIAYNSLIIAFEQMKKVAYISFVEVIIKLVIAFCLSFYLGDKLILYSFLMFLSTAIVCGIYIYYSKKIMPSLKLRRIQDKKTEKEILSYTGWNTVDSIAGIASTQGVNLLLGYFQGPLVNAARGLAYQISVTLNHFVLSFITASKPQIIKYYAEGDLPNLQNLVFRSSKFSFYLLLMVSIPIFLYSEFILRLWLGEVPAYVVSFTRVILLTILVDVISYSLMTQIQATGNIRVFSLVISFVKLTVLPISYVLLLLNFSVVSVFVANLVIIGICLIIRLFLMKVYVNLDVVRFSRTVLFPIVLVFVCTFLLSVVFDLYSSMDLTVVIKGLIITYLSFFMSVVFLGTSSSERNLVKDLVKKKVFKR